jgi:hypothetical protein
MILLAERPEKSRKFALSGNAEGHALRDVRPMAVQRAKKVSPRLEWGRQPDPNRAIGDWRGDPDEGFGQLESAVLVDQQDLGADHQVAVSRRNNLVLKFNERNDGMHAALVSRTFKVIN